MTFAEVVEEVDQLTLDEQTALIDLMRHRLADRRRKEIVAQVEESRIEYRETGGRAVSASELVDEILS